MTHLKPRATNRIMILLIWLLCAGLMAPMPAIANEPDYDQPAHWLLPWSCEEGHRITWGPEDHWANGKASGVAYDFSFKTGTPLWAPTAGRAYFLYDERPLATNYGHYVEIVTHDGQWLIRMAHLRDPQQGERDVQAGEIIGHSGSSGVSVEHLHLEILVKQDDLWIRPDPDQLAHLFGINRENWIEGALLTNHDCPAQLELIALHLGEMPIRLGEAGQTLLALRNEGLEQIDVQTIQIMANGPDQATIIEERTGQWQLGPQASLWVPIAIRPTVAGIWRIQQLTCETSHSVSTFALDQIVEVAASSLHVEIADEQGKALSFPVGEHLRLPMTLFNTGQQTEEVESLFITGTRPDGSIWQSVLDGPVSLSAAQQINVTFLSQYVSRMVGDWTITQVGYEQDQRRFILAQMDQTVQVSGPELVGRSLSIHTSAHQITALLHITNVGTEPIAPDQIELWGWLPDGTSPVVIKRNDIAPIAPGCAALIQLAGESNAPTDLLRFVESGYWLDGQYVPILLPTQVSSAPQPIETDLSHDHLR